VASDVTALQAGPCPAYDEETFHYFLDLEQKRTAISNESFLLMLVDLNRRGETDRPIDSVTAAKLFSILSRCLRETDFAGWYSEGRIAGAVLTQDGRLAGDEQCSAVRLRVETELKKHLPSRLGRDLHVCIRRMPQSATCPS
jgi:hypothetical protein